MRRAAVCLSILIMLSFAGQARAEGLNNLYAGINSLVSFYADPFVMVVIPPDEFEELPAHKVTGRILAIPAGTLLSAYRVMMAAFDIAFTPFWVFPTMSPEPRWETIEGVEYE
jgi:hypothetical protein